MTMTDTAQDQARAQFESVAAMVARLEHSQECNERNGGECDITDAVICDALGVYISDPDGHVTDDEWEDYHDPVHAAEAIDEHPLSVQVREGWHSPGDNLPPAEFEILLCTGGPAVRMRGTLLDPDSQPGNPRLEYQDWGTPWTEYRHITMPPDPETIVAELHRYRETLLAYARQFWCGE